MKDSIRRVKNAFRHKAPDRTPIFEIFQPFHPIFWDICGRTIATDMTMNWDAKADGISWEELIEEEAKARFTINKFFQMDIVHIRCNLKRDFPRPKKINNTEWELNGRRYILNEKTKLINLKNTSENDASSYKFSEDECRNELDLWDEKAEAVCDDVFAVYKRFRELASAEHIEWVYMFEGGGAGTGAAFYPPFLLMWIILEPELYKKWLFKKKTNCFAVQAKAISLGFDIIVIGGDVSSDKGTIISPEQYHTFLFPIIKEQVELIHKNNKLAVYTSDGNHWAIKEDMFLNSGIDGYKEIDKAAGMTMEKLIKEGIDEKVCLIGNIDARYTMCLGTEKEVAEETIACLEYGRKSPGGHILHLSHSVHEDVKSENYYALINAYRDYFGLAEIINTKKFRQ